MKEDTESLKIKYEYENNCNYIVVREDKCIADDYQTTMLGRNKIEHFLSFDIRVINGDNYVYYDISSKQQLTKLFEYGKLVLEDVKAVCRSLSETVRLAKSYMLDLDRIVIEPRYMYMDIHNKSIWFLYRLSDGTETFSQRIRRLFEYILEHFDHASGKQDIVQLYELYQHILIGDYDPENLMFLFYDSQDKRKDDNEEHQEMGEYTEKRERDKQECPKKEIVIEDVPKETVIDETEIQDKRAVIAVKTMKTAVILLMLYSMVALFAPEYVVIRLTMIQAVVLFGVAAVLYGALVELGKRADVLRRIVKIPRQVAYTIKETDIEKPVGDESEKHDRRIVEEKDNISLIEDSRQVTKGKSAELSNDSKSDHQSEEVCNHTVLLSEYIMGKQRTRNLKLMFWQTEEYGEQPELVKIEPEKYPCVIGSMSNLADFVINKPFISRMHACIQKKESAYYIEDLNSTNGTFVNDSRVKGYRAKSLEDGDVLRLGMLSYKVEIS